MNIGAYIRDLRKSRGMTQQELADKSGVSLMSIRRYESGEREPRHDILKKIADALQEWVLCFYGVQEFREEEIKQTDDTGGQDDFLEHAGVTAKSKEILAILARIYRRVEFKEVAGYDWAAQYYSVSEKTGNSFVLYDSDLNAIYDAIAAYLPAVINGLKDVRTEKEVIASFEEWKKTGKSVKAEIFEVTPISERDGFEKEIPIKEPTKPESADHNSNK